MTALEQIRNQNKIMREVFAGRLLKGDSMATLLEKVVEVVEQNNLFERDIITGRIRSLPLATSQDRIITPTEAEGLFRTFFCDKMFVINQKGNRAGDFDTKTTQVSSELQKTIFQQTLQLCVYNSRIEMFNKIPEWDGEKRIDGFMKKYFMCDTNPHFFWLFLTNVVGKMHDPENNRVEHWFDFIGKAKGTGKSSFFQHLLGSIGYGKCAINGRFNKRSAEDFYVECYNANAVIVCDDECTWVVGSDSNKGGVSYDEFKSMTTNHWDTFSRKFCQPETHARPFVIVRTSNHPKTVFAANERRQIIFNVGLPEYTCLHWQLDDYYMAQLLAEAKAYYLENGMYKLTVDDKEEIYKQNLENINTDTTDYFVMEEFFEAVKADKTGKYDVHLRTKNLPDGYYWTTYRFFTEWYQSNKHGKVMGNTQFWKQVAAYAKMYPGQYYFEDKDYKNIKGSSTKAFGISLKEQGVNDEEDLSDIPF